MMVSKETSIKIKKKFTIIALSVMRDIINIIHTPKRNYIILNIRIINLRIRNKITKLISNLEEDYSLDKLFRIFPQHQ